MDRGGTDPLARVRARQVQLLRFPRQDVLRREEDLLLLRVFL